MVIRRKKAKDQGVTVPDRGFDSFDLKLGDLMRGERATMGKSLLDVEREIRIRASYVAAIENADPDAFDTPGFIPGYVRSYARYLGMDPDEAFATFCKECGFSVAHGMSAGASSIRKPDQVAPRQSKRPKDPLMDSKTPFVPASEGLFSNVEPGALGSAAVLVALIAGIGYGGWTVLNQVQQVQFAPVENTPDVLTNLDPLDGVVVATAQDSAADQPRAQDQIGLATATPHVVQESGFDRIYRPEALDVPVMIARDAPISTLDPGEVGTLNTQIAQTESYEYDPVEAAIASVLAGTDVDATPVGPTPQVLADGRPGVSIVAVRPAWVQVTSAVDGSVIFSGTLNGGETYQVENLEQPPLLRVGESGAVYFQMAGQHYGPVGASGTVTKNLSLAANSLAETYEPAILGEDQDLERYVAELELGQPQ